MNGDLVDRGSWSIEVILTAFAFKCMFPSEITVLVGLTQLKGLYPTSMYINRGNHETKDMNRTYGFEGEAKTKHGEQTYKVCQIYPRRSNTPVDCSTLFQLFAHVFTASKHNRSCIWTVQTDPIVWLLALIDRVP